MNGYGFGAEPAGGCRARITLLLSNLLANPLTHGASERPVRVTAESRDGGFILAVSNAGEPIPAETFERLF